MPSDDESSDGEDFSWSEYLQEHNAIAAPKTNFCQNLTPPENEFDVDHKLETFDPRNTTSTCLGTVIETSGPRVRLRLDGTDDRNDFWLMVDSDLIHPYGYSQRNNRKIQPPLGFGNDLSKWPKFLDKIIQTSDEKIFAPEKCFKQAPLKPLKNEFKVAQKLEAVDPKNPHLICPATIKEIKRDRLLVMFDGWSQSSQSWFPFTSRDIFPVGWCKVSGHILQYPGNLPDKKTSLNHNKSANETARLKKASPKVTTKGKLLNKSIKTPKAVAKKLSTLETSNMSASSSSLNLTGDATHHITDTTLLSPPKDSTLPKKQTVSTPNMLTTTHLSQIDLSIVKQEAVDSGNDDSIQAPNGHLKNVNLNTNGEINKQTGFVPQSHAKSKGTAYVHLIPDGSCGKLIKTDKFHQAHTKFGPGSVSSVYKSIVQSFVDCAVNRYEIFQLIPEGNSHDIVRLKNTNYNVRKRLISIENINEMWSSIKSFCKLLDIDDEKLFSKHKSTQSINSENHKPINEQKENPSTEVKPALNMQNVNPKVAENSPMEVNCTSVKTVSQKRASQATENPVDDVNKEAGLSTAKCPRLEATYCQLHPCEWAVFDVVHFISDLNDNYFASYVETFKLQEIDGKALILLTTDILMKYMGFKLGPALKLNNYIEKLRKNILPSTSSEITQPPNVPASIKTESKDFT